MAPPSSTERRLASVLLAATLLVATAVLSAACSSPATDEPGEETRNGIELEDPPRRYAAEWLIDADAVNADAPSPYLYREVVDDRTGRYLVQSPNHLAFQTPDEVVLCAAIMRVPLDPYCASTPRAEGAPNVLSYPVQLLRDWSPRSVYDLAGYRAVAFAAASDAENWSRRDGLISNDIAVECFVVTGTTTAAATGFEICFTDDDLHLVASVDLQSDLVFEIDLLSYTRTDVSDEFETGLDDFIEERPTLLEQLLDLYPEVPAPRPTPTPVLDDG